MSKVLDDLFQGCAVTMELPRDLKQSAEALGLRVLHARVASARPLMMPLMTHVFLNLVLDTGICFKNTFMFNDLEIHQNATDPRRIAELIQCRYDHAKAELLALACEPRADEPAIVEKP